MGAVLPDFGGYRRIIQTQGSVSIFYDTGQGQGWQRIISVNASPHLPASIRQRFGDSRGHWEGNTLVVETTNFTDKVSFHGAREGLRLVERFTRVDADTLNYRFTVDDPTTWTRPWTVEMPLSKSSEAIYEYACHEGNYGLLNILRNARTDEQRATGATGAGR
jgi:hypothetical protein